MSRCVYNTSSIYFPVERSYFSLIWCSRYARVFSRARSSTCLDTNTQHRWESCRKKKVALRVGYVGTDYKGLQLQRFDSLPTIEEELQSAIYKAGGIRDSNYGDLQKIRWARSSRTDKGVHSLATIITLKMEIPEDAWKNDPNGILLASYVNYHLPYNIKVFSILSSQGSFDARRECNFRMYSYIIPAEIIGLNSGCCIEEVEEHLSDFNDILKSFEGEHPFHNFTSRSKYRKPLTRKRNEIVKPISSENESALLIEEIEDEHLEQEFSSEIFSYQDQFLSPVKKARWLSKPDEMDRLNSSHFRKIFKCSCGNLETLSGVNYIELSIHGESFMFRQIRKMVGTAVAVKRGLLPRDIIALSLSKYSRIILPVAPAEVLLLRNNRFSFKNRPGNIHRPEMILMAESEVIQNEVDEFYRSVLLPRLLKFLDPKKLLWLEWLHNLESGVTIPDEELDEVRKAWNVWKELLKTKKETI